jgi:hypothetical protein
VFFGTFTAKGSQKTPEKLGVFWQWKKKNCQKTPEKPGVFWQS